MTFSRTCVSSLTRCDQLKAAVVAQISSGTLSGIKLKMWVDRLGQHQDHAEMLKTERYDAHGNLACSFLICSRLPCHLPSLLTAYTPHNSCSQDVSFLAQHNHVEDLINGYFRSDDAAGLKWIQEKHGTLAKSMQANPWLVRLNWTADGRVPQRVANLRHVAERRQYEQ